MQQIHVSINLLLTASQQWNKIASWLKSECMHFLTEPFPVNHCQLQQGTYDLQHNGRQCRSDQDESLETDGTGIGCELDPFELQESISWYQHTLLLPLPAQGSCKSHVAALPPPPPLLPEQNNFTLHIWGPPVNHNYMPFDPCEAVKPGL